MIHSVYTRKGKKWTIGDEVIVQETWSECNLIPDTNHLDEFCLY